MDEINKDLSEEKPAPAPGTPEPTDADQLDRGPYVDGFSMRTVVGAIFVALVMMPGAIYMGLVAGQTLGTAAEWVTIILFAELARRSFNVLKRQEVYILFYVASGIASVALIHLALAGGPFAMTIWNQYLLQAPETSTISEQIPDWVVPPVSSPGIQNRNLAHVDWWWSQSKGILSPMLLITFGYILGRVSFFAFGYLLFRMLSDTERLPYPIAPIAAEGATALAEGTERLKAGEKRVSWRRDVFGVGATLGIIFGSLYVLLPVVSGLFLSKQIMIFPIPFVDMTSRVEHILPASLVSISFDAAIFMTGMLLPFPLIIGIFTTCVVTSFVAGPLLYHLDMVPHWSPGNGLLVNQMVLGFDFWMSVMIGVGGAILLIGVWNLIKAFSGHGRSKVAEQEDADEAWRKDDPNEPPYRQASRERGDFPVWLAIGLFLLASALYCWICMELVPDFPFWMIVMFAFIWTPIHSYVSGRMVGLTGQPLMMPFLKEAVFITSGYRKIDIWFAPIPLMDYGPAGQRFRELELTRTKFTSVVKAELLMLPIIFVMSFLFWWFFWHLNQIPSSAFPFAARVWPIQARSAFLIYTANATESSLLLEALKPSIMAGAGVVGLIAYALLNVAGLPVIFFYGLAGGIGQPLHMGMNMFLGAILGRYYFRKKFGAAKWSRYTPVVVAGFMCGMGLAGMTAVAMSLVVNCVKSLPY